MRELHGNEQIVGGAPALAMRPLDRFAQPGELSRIAAMNPKLPRIGAAVLPHAMGNGHPASEPDSRESAD